MNPYRSGRAVEKYKTASKRSFFKTLLWKIRVFFSHKLVTPRSPCCGFRLMKPTREPRSLQFSTVCPTCNVRCYYGPTLH